MKTKILTLTFVFSISILAKAQETKVRHEKSDEIIEFVNGIRNIERFHDFANCCVNIKLIESTDSIGTFPGEVEKDIILYNLYLRIQLLDEESGKTTMRNLWVEGGYHNPRNYRFEAKNRRVTFIHGTEKEPINISITITETGVLIE